MNKERAASYLGQGVPPGQVANIMGCTPAYISQLLKEEDFKELVLKHQATVNGSPDAEETSLVAKATGLQHMLMRAIGDSMANAELPALAKALDTVSQVADRIAQRKMPAEVGTNAGQTQIVHVSLTLPGHAVQAPPVIELNAKSEVVSIDNKPMAPMSSKGVEALFRAKKAEVVVEKAVELGILKEL